MMPICLNVLIIDDEERSRENIASEVATLGHAPITAQSGEVVCNMPLHKLREIDVAIIDQRMPGMNGFETANKLKELHPGILPVMLTAFGSQDHARSAFHNNFVDYLSKPVSKEVVRECFSSPKIRQVIEFKRIIHEKCVAYSEKYCFFGESAAGRELKKNIESAARADATVLILGESGSGKEMVARMIHNFSDFRDKPFAPLNCAAIPKNMVESALFGHVPKAFNDAVKRDGLFLTANGGTVFLDEIGEMPFEQQAKLLRVLQEKTVKPVGADREIPVNFRLIAATNGDLEEMIEKKAFREDLFYRLNIFPIEVPPLRSRKNDIPDLIRFFMNRLPSDDLKLTVEVEARFLEFHWPGNVRELENLITSAYWRRNWDKALEYIEKKSGTKLKPRDYIGEPKEVDDNRANDCDKEHLERVVKKLDAWDAAAEGVPGLNQSKLGLKLGITHAAIGTFIDQYPKEFVHLLNKHPDKWTFIRRLRKLSRMLAVIK